MPQATERKQQWVERLSAAEAELAALDPVRLSPKEFENGTERLNRIITAARAALAGLMQAESAETYARLGDEITHLQEVIGAEEEAAAAHRRGVVAALIAAGELPAGWTELVNLGRVVGGAAKSVQDGERIRTLKGQLGDILQERRNLARQVAG